MYLEAEVYVSPYSDKEAFETIRKLDIENLKDYEPKFVSYEIGYWRKANAIHRWFVEKAQGGKDDCERYPVSLELLKELREICQTVLNNPNADAADILLPTSSGFFFGSTDYGEWYLDYLKITIEIIDRIFENPKHENWAIYYRASW